MLDLMCCFTEGGVLLWCFYLAKIPQEPLHDFIKNILIEARAGSSCANVGGYCFQWMCVNAYGLIFAAAYRGVRQISHIEYLLQQTANAFTKRIQTLDSPLDYPLYEKDFDEPFDKVFVDILQRHQQKNKATGENPSKTIFKKKSSIGRQNDQNDAKKSKEMTQWDLKRKVTQKDMDALDQSKKTMNENGNSKVEARYYDDESESDEEVISKAPIGQSLFSFLPKRLQDLAGNKVLTDEDIEEALPTLRSHLSSKNVAEEVIDQLLLSCRERLVGTRTKSFTSVRETIKCAVAEAITKILTPKKCVDVLRLCLEAKAEGRVFSIAFLGINGVGKSTNLAKVAYYLKNKGGLSVLIAACDTFRAGAVEQLRTHSRCLEVPLFERGYGKDAAAIAKEALSYAQTSNIDVVLIDTAGRMQDNEPLMRALSQLVVINNPDMVLFVGEALVGNDAVHQLKAFNQTIIDATSRSGNPRRVDGILLTKFDTVDDKVGAALSMVYITGQPVVFVGTGQKYRNLKKLDADAVVQSLLS